jgi:Ca-activated chloride channel family protein
VGIIAFAGAAYLQCPMTLDQEMAMLVLKALDTESVGVQGTDLGDAIRKAIEAFERGAGEGGRSLVLITDGEDNEGRGVKMAEEAAKKGIKIYAVGIGTERGVPLTEQNGGFKEDDQGAKVSTKMRLDMLNAIVKPTGGVAIAAGDSPGYAVDKIARMIANAKATELDSHRQILFQDRFQWFLAPALILLLWMLLIRPEPTRLEHQEQIRAMDNEPVAVSNGR